MVLPLQPHQTGTGSQKRAAAHLSAICDSADVHLVILDADTTPGKLADTTLLSRCVNVSHVRYERRARRPVSLLPPFSIIAEMRDPLISRRLPSRAAVAKIFSHFANRPIDVALAFKVQGATMLELAESVVPMQFARRIVDFDDIESEVYYAEANAALGVESTVIEWMTQRAQRRTENRCLKEFDTVWICSELDRRRLAEREPRASISVIPNCVPLPEVLPPPGRSDRVNLLFLGKMSYDPNRDGAVWFVREVLGKIRAQLPGVQVHLSIVGFGPPPDVKALEEIGNVVVTGGVETVDPYYRDADIVVAPIRAGGGTRIKILEAMSYGRPVVATEKGAEGIDVADGESILLGNSAEAFARACVELIRAPEKRASIARRGRQLVEKCYSDRVVGESVRASVFKDA